MTQGVTKINLEMLKKLLIFSVIMFGFGYALVPMYEKFCEVTGINNLLQPDVVDKNIKVDMTRTIAIELDANVRGLPWQFKPLQSNVKIHPGESLEVMYEISNVSDQEISGQAIPSYSPRFLEKYMKKFECFCFTKQVLKPGETRQMPVKFVIDPQIPVDVNTVTISYTFFALQPGK
ncbi:cytochrome c oxidase assembly protein [Nitrosomonas communis]|uniref:Cytochrome c oxidase assembly protein CtaG n=1 Tax=Nitrosomonas communis TaxID=44574 RepID=A0A1I4PJ18_9PROT|nr:cytochrome c oxidase assembly protein [Nitrosomonas communis]SFM27505.1 cytochrome c oxidase assembly protein subunit 11 [Nitrosomonas communis]